MRKRESISILFLCCHYTSLVLVRPETRDHTQPGIKSAESPPLLSSPHRAKTCEAQRLSSSHCESERWELGDCDSDFLSITNTKQEQPLTKSVKAMTDKISEQVSVVVSSITWQDVASDVIIIIWVYWSDLPVSAPVMRGERVSLVGAGATTTIYVCPTMTCHYPLSSGQKVGQ